MGTLLRLLFEIKAEKDVVGMRIRECVEPLSWFKVACSVRDHVNLKVWNRVRVFARLVEDNERSL